MNRAINNYYLSMLRVVIIILLFHNFLVVGFDERDLRTGKRNRKNESDFALMLQLNVKRLSHNYFCVVDNRKMPMGFQLWPTAKTAVLLNSKRYQTDLYFDWSEQLKAFIECLLLSSSSYFHKNGNIYSMFFKPVSL